MKRKQMPRLVVMTMPGTDTKVVSEGKQYVDSASSVVEEVSLKNMFLIVDVNQHISKQYLLPGLAHSGYKPAIASACME
jgi:hypothetical protein